METKSNATETNAQTIATGEGAQVTTPTNDDLEAKIQALEAEKSRLIEEGANYKMAYLKEKKKNKEEIDFEEEDDDKITRKVNEAIAKTRLAEIAREQDDIIKKALKENKELKLAVANKTTTPSAAIGTHSETVAVQDTLITPEQMAAFKARGWSDKDIERYKKNLRARM